MILGRMIIAVSMMVAGSVFFSPDLAVAQNITRNIAQASDGGALNERLERLQRDVILLQRQIYSQGTGVGIGAGRGSGSKAAKAGAAVAIGGGGDKATKRLAIRVETRMNELEDEIRKITGQSEEMSFKLGEIDDRLNLLLSDMGLRLDALEKKMSLGGGSSGPSGKTSAANSGKTSGAISGEVSGGEAPVRGETAGASSFSDSTQVLGVLKTPVNEDGEPTAGQSVSSQEAALEPQAAAPILPQGSPAEQYEFALGKLWQSDYAGAQKALQEFIQTHGDHELAGNAKYWLGETYYVRKDYTNAAVIFAEGFEKYPSGAKAADNLLKLGLSLANIDEKDQACKAFSELGKRFPNASSGIINRVVKERKQIGCK